MRILSILRRALGCGLLALSGLVLSAQGGTPAGNFTFPSQPTSIDMFFTIEASPGVGAGIYQANQFWLNDTAGTGGYCGLQTDVSPCVGNSGKGVVFAIWNTTASRPSAGTCGEPFGGEGVGYHLLRHFDWTVGRQYRFHLAPEGGGWWGCTVRDMSTGTDTYLGALGTVNATAFQATTSTFTEFYLGTPCGSRPYARCRYAVSSGATVATPNNPHTYNTCPGEATCAISGNSIVSEVGSCLLTNSCSGNGGPLPDGTYTVTNGASGLVWDDPGSATTSGTNVILYAATGGNNQKWQFTSLGNGYYKIVNLTSGLCLNDPGSSTTSGTLLIQYPYGTGTPNEQWLLTPSGNGYLIECASSSLMVDPNGNTSQAKIRQATATGTSNQVWIIQ